MRFFVTLSTILLGKVSSVNKVVAVLNSHFYYKSYMYKRLRAFQTSLGETFLSSRGNTMIARMLI